MRNFSAGSSEYLPSDSLSISLEMLCLNEVDTNLKLLKNKVGVLMEIEIKMSDQGIFC